MNDFKKLLIWLDSLNPKLNAILMMLLFAVAICGLGSFWLPVEGYFWIRFPVTFVSWFVLFGISAEIEKQRRLGM